MFRRERAPPESPLPFGEGVGERGIAGQDRASPLPGPARRIRNTVAAPDLIRGPESPRHGFDLWLLDPGSSLRSVRGGNRGWVGSKPRAQAPSPLPLGEGQTAAPPPYPSPSSEGEARWGCSGAGHA